MRKRGRWLFVVGRCTVGPAVDTFVYCIQTAEDIVKFLSRPGSHIVIVLDPKPVTQFQRVPFQLGCKLHGVCVENLRFSAKIAVYRGNGSG